MANKPKLTSRDHQKMDVFLGNVLDDYKAGHITKVAAVNGLAHVMAALDIDNYGEVRAWFEQGRASISEQSQV